MIRRAFTLKLKPGKLDEYKKRHDEIWPELVEKSSTAAWRASPVLSATPMCFVFGNPRRRRVGSLVGDRDSQQMGAGFRAVDFEPLMEIESGVPVAGELREIFHLETNAE